MTDKTTNAAMRDPDAFAEGVVAERARIERIIENFRLPGMSMSANAELRYIVLSAIRGGDDA